MNTASTRGAAYRGAPSRPLLRRLAKALGVATLLVALFTVGGFALEGAASASGAWRPVSFPIQTFPVVAASVSANPSALPTPPHSTETTVPIEINAKAEVPTPAQPSASVSPRPTTSPELVVDLNTATLEELRKLPGVGPKRAAAILELRTKLGQFRRVEELLRVRGFGRKSLARLRPNLVVRASK